MQTSEKLAAFAEAFVGAQADMKGATKDAKNPHFRSDYATLASVIEAGRDALAKHGFCVLQGLSSADAALVVTTRLLHKSGEWIEDSLAVPLAKHDAQGMGSAATYGRRYALAAMLGIAQVDDDGNDATAKAPTRPAMQHSASQPAHDAYESLPDEAKTALREAAMEIIALTAEGNVPAVMEIVGQMCVTQDDKLALWSLLPAPARAAIKRAETAKRTAQ